MAPFCSCPASLVSRKFFAVGPGCAKCFFFVALRWAPRPFGGARAKKKNTTQGVFFLLRPRGKAREGEAPLGAGTGPEQKKKHHPGCFFFCCGPGEKQGKEKPHWAPAWGQSKKKTPPRVFFFLLRPRGKAGEGEAPLGAGTGPEQKKKKRADAHSLTAGLGGDASPRRGGVFFFAAAPPGPGWCFFFCCGPARTLTHSRWAGAISARPGWCFFFLLRPRRVFLDNNQKCLGYYIGSKKTRRGHSKKKNTTSIWVLYY